MKRRSSYFAKLKAVGNSYLQRFLRQHVFAAIPMDNAKMDQVVASKFNLVVAMQRFEKFTEQEQESVNFLLEVYPSLNIAYIEEDENGHHYTCLINASCEKSGPNGRRKPKFRIRLPGFPILGDGKSDVSIFFISVFPSDY